MTTLRLDQYLVNNGLVSSRERAGELIRKGGVAVNGDVVKRPGRKFDDGVEVSLLEEPMPWVSRGALKLLAALPAFNIRPLGRKALDVGASTGGFTEVLLAHDVELVYALDTGTGQLVDKLKSDPRVINIEKQNIRTAPEVLLEHKVNLVVIDVSFISLKLVLPEVLRFTTPDADIIALVKPQFEVGPEGLGKNGIVKNPKVREKAVTAVIDTAKSLGLQSRGRIESPIEGGDGNVEYLIHLK